MLHGGGWWSYIRYDEQKDRPQVSRDLLLRVIQTARPYWGQALLMLAAILVVSLLGLIPPLLIRELIDVALPEQDIALLNRLALGMIAVSLLSGLIGVGQRYLGASIGEGLIADLRQALYAHMQRMSLRFFTHTKTGELMSRLNNDVVGAQRAVTGTFIDIITNIVALVTTLAIMFSLEWRLTLLSVIIFPLFVLPARRVGRVLRQIVREALDKNAAMNAMMNETLNVSGALLTKLFGRQADEIDRFIQRSREVRDIGIRRAVVGRWFFLSLSLASAIGTALVFWAGGRLVIAGAFTIGTIVAFTSYLAQLYGPMASLTNARVEFAQSLVSFERVFEVLDLPVEIKDAPDSVALDQVEGHVRFEDVSFSYLAADEAGAFLPGVTTSALSEDGRNGRDNSSPEDDRSLFMVTRAADRQWAIRQVSFEIKPGQLVALVGPSGAGKTTVTYLLPRLYDPTEGRIVLDGYDLRQVQMASLAQQIGMVTQETYLFHDTIRANLLYAKPDATQAEIEAACQAANIHDFIASLPDGYETVVGERGYRLSGGEKQRMAIARVILKDPCILVLDEATSSLDSQSEALIQAALERVMQGRTSLVIAHRLSTILAADLILVLDAGRLVEQGTHAELLAQGGLYADLYHTQFHTERGTI
ncbi:MAG: ABC transporter ATP-binding protein [Anaerolineae bacterium]